MTITYHNGLLVQSPGINVAFWGQAWDPQKNPSLDRRERQVAKYISNFVSLDGFFAQLAEYKITQQVPFGFNGSDIITSGPAPNTTVSDAQIQTMLDQEIGKHNLFPPLPDQMYLVVTPPNVTVTFNGGTSQKNFVGYHNSFVSQSYPGKEIIYVVIPDQAGNAKLAGLSAFQQDTAVFSHEFAEAVTDPDSGGWWDSDPNSSTYRAEIGDVTANQEGIYQGYTTQKIWSVQQNKGVLPSNTAHWTPFGPSLVQRIVAQRDSAQPAGDGLLQAFAQRANGQVWHRQETTTNTWGAWSPVGAFAVKSTEAVTRRDANQELFGISLQYHTLYTTTETSPGAASWGPWSLVGANNQGFLANQYCVGSNQNGALQVFAIPSSDLSGSGGGGPIWTTFRNADGWVPWHKLNVFNISATNYTPVPAPSTFVTVASEPCGLMDLIALDAKGQVWSARQAAINTDQWIGWTPLSGLTAQSISALELIDGRIGVFAIAAGTGAVECRSQITWNQLAWQPTWTALGNPVAAQSLVVANEQYGGAEVFIVGADQAAWTLDSSTYGDDFGDSQWYSLGGKFQSLSVGMDRTGPLLDSGLALFGVDASGNVEMARALKARVIWN
jgi:hypothetical protein